MKFLTLIRHAKSSWSDPTLRDFDRPLNKRGLRNAPFMGTKLLDKEVHFDRIYSSPAKRAVDTAHYICTAMGYDLDKIETDPVLYHASGDVLLDFVHAIDDRFSTVALVSHNPGLNELANMLNDNPIDNIPTTGVVIFKTGVDRWSEIENNVVSLYDFDYPKRYKQNQSEDRA